MRKWIKVITIRLDTHCKDGHSGRGGKIDGRSYCRKEGWNDFVINKCLFINHSFNIVFLAKQFWAVEYECTKITLYWVTNESKFETLTYYKLKLRQNGAWLACKENAQSWTKPTDKGLSAVKGTNELKMGSQSKHVSSRQSGRDV